MTRFEIVLTRRTRESHSISYDGSAGLQKLEVMAETVDEVVCSWCGLGDAVRELG
jgi:hypothetical protein